MNAQQGPADEPEPTTAPGIRADRARILVVEDDERVALALIPALERAGYQVDRAATGAEALARAADVDLVLLDLGLPDIDGIEVCRRLRQTSSVAVIAVTARGAGPDRVGGLRAGADDYVVKPFSLAELTARIDAVLRRAGGADPRHQWHEVGPLVVDGSAHTVTVAGQPVALTRKEFDLLAVLAASPGRTFSRAELLEAVWHTRWEGRSRTVDVHVATLRHKLGLADLIRTVHGVGYQLVAP